MIIQQKPEIILIISMIPVFHWNNENKKIFESLNLLGPIVPIFSFVKILKNMTKYMVYALSPCRRRK